MGILTFPQATYALFKRYNIISLLFSCLQIVQNCANQQWTVLGILWRSNTHVHWFIGSSLVGWWDYCGHLAFLITKFCILWTSFVDIQSDWSGRNTTYERREIIIEPFFTCRSIRSRIISTEIVHKRLFNTKTSWFFRSINYIHWNTNISCTC